MVSSDSRAALVRYANALQMIVKTRAILGALMVEAREARAQIPAEILEQIEGELQPPPSPSAGAREGDS